MVRKGLYWTVIVVSCVVSVLLIALIMLHVWFWVYPEHFHDNFSRPFKKYRVEQLERELAENNPGASQPIAIRYCLYFTDSTAAQPFSRSVFRELMVYEFLDLSPFSGTDISPLKGWRICSLNLRDSRIKDLSALKDIPLKSLDISNSKVNDLTPLIGAALEVMEFKNTPAEKDWGFIEKEVRRNLNNNNKEKTE